MGILQGEHTLHQLVTQQQSGTRDGNIPKQQHPVRLSIITQFYPPDYAATGQLIEELATQLRHYGLYVHIFTGQPGYAFQKETAPTIERKDKMLIRRSRTAQLWPRRIRGKAVNGLLFCLRSGFHLLKNCWRGDVLLLTTAPPFLPLLGYLANLCFGLPYVCLLYDLYPDVAVELQVVSVHNWLVRLWNLVNQQIWKNAKGVIVLSPSMKERIVAKCPEIADKVTVIHSWADPTRIVPIPKQNNWFAQKHNLVDKFTVLYSGNMGRCHDMETIIEVAKLLQDEPIQFVFIGDGAKRQACLEETIRLGLKNCLFLPYQDKQKLPHSLTACDLSLVSISPGMEGLVAPSKLYGILAAGRPVGVICEERSYLRQLIEEAKCGATFRNEDATGLANFIRRLASDTQLGHQMGKAGRSYLKSNFTLEIIAQQYSEVLNQALFTEVKPKSAIAVKEAH
ncbi:glycosyltransferase family 4 protein [Argonema galeatum]|uniref:glycosyltransferase family 4 protein n=1 Tax=Argonema galeatum TaxID=2942762 RepID=UPI002012D4B0|nr:glycosyltransferase family 4 protein [Argonema galeatum]MCL1468523.1 glycosyltransferase family 4 protein [Argonema galeatum A003/A1]